MHFTFNFQILIKPRNQASEIYRWRNKTLRGFDLQSCRSSVEVHTILIVMLSVWEIFRSALACVEVRLLRAVLGCFFFRPHKYIFANTPLSPLRSLPLVFSSQIVCFHAWTEKWEYPRGELALIHLWETGAKAEKASLNAVVSTVPVSKSLALCVLRFTLLLFNNTFTICVHNDSALNDEKSFNFTENWSDDNHW